MSEQEVLLTSRKRAGKEKPEQEGPSILTSRAAKAKPKARSAD
jgi:hypothetical protein